jgi:PAS domain S-box-containing protein
MLGLDAVYIRLNEPPLSRVVHSPAITASQSELVALLDHPDPQSFPARQHQSRYAIGDGNLTTMTLRLGLHDEVGLLVAGSVREGFPVETERLVLRVAANQAALALQEARIIGEQRTMVAELDRRVAQRTSELASTADELRKEIAGKTAITDCALDCIVFIDHEARITEFNPAAEATFGYTRSEVLGRPLAEVIVPPALREAHRRGFERYLRTGEARVLGRRIEMAAVRADGSEFPVELTITRLPSDGPPAFTGYLRDITAQKLSEEELRRSEAHLTEAQRLSHSGSFGWKLATDEHYWSAQTYAIFGFDVAAKITLPLILERVHPDDVALLKETLASAEDGRDLDYEYRLRMPDGALKHLHVVAHSARDEQGRVEYTGAVQDITDRRVSEETLAELRAQLAHAARVTTLGALAASIAHEVNQPLSGIVTNAGTCIRMLATEPPNLEGARETAIRTARDGRRAADVIKRLRALFSKEVVAEPLDLNEATREVVALSSSEIQRDAVALRMELSDDIPPIVGDRVQLQQVVLNLILNAIEAMRSIEDRPKTLLVRTERDGGGCVRLTVRDSGPGFAPNDAGKLFEAFFTTKAAGMGMGLSVSRTIVESHDGHLWAVSHEGQGATFGFTIPCGTPETGVETIRAE